MIDDLPKLFAVFDRQVAAQRGPAWDVLADAQAAIHQGAKCLGEEAFPLVMPGGVGATNAIAFLRWHYKVELAADAFTRAARDGILDQVFLHFLRE